MNEETEVYHGSGNVFADLGLPDAEERLAKAELAPQILNIIARRRLTQAQAAELLGIDQPKVSALTRGKLSGFSMERLFHFLNGPWPRCSEYRQGQTTVTATCPFEGHRSLIFLGVF